MPASKVITFEKPFKYSHGGEFYEADFVTVFEPTYRTRAIDRKVSNIIMKAMMGCANNARGAKGDEEEVANPEAKIPDDTCLDILTSGIEDLDVVSRIYDGIEKSLTNNAELACIADTGVPLQATTWERISEANDLEGVNRIISVFASFFVDRALRSLKSANGSNESTNYQSSMGGNSRSTPRLTPSVN